MPGSLQSAGRRVGRITADQSVGGMTLGEGSSCGGGMQFTEDRFGGFFEGNLGTLLLTSYTEMDLTAYSRSLNKTH